MKKKFYGNQFNRVLSWLVTLTMLFSLAIPAFSLSEGTDATPTDKIAIQDTATPEPTAEPTATPEPTAAPTATPEPTAVPTATPEPTAAPTATPEPTAEPTATPEPTAVPTATPEPTAVPTATPEPTVEPTATPVPTPTPYTGYARLTEHTCVYGSATATEYDYKLPKTSNVYLDKVVLAGTDRIEINFAVDGVATSGFVEPDTLEALTANEQKDLVTELLKLEEYACYDDDPALPLTELAPEYDEAPATATATPEITAAPTDTVAPTATPASKTILAANRAELDNVMRDALKYYNSVMTIHYCSSVDQLQSAHPYANLSRDLYVYSVANAAYLSVTFSSDTQVENPSSTGYYDVIAIYNAKGVYLTSFTGLDLAGKTITLPGDTVQILLLSDHSYYYYGFRVTDVTAYTTPAAPTITPVDSTHVRLGWSSSAAIQGYEIYSSSTATGTYNYLSATTGNSYDAVVPAGQVTYFKIKAYNDLTSSTTGTTRYYSGLSAYQSIFPLAKATISTAVQNGNDASAKITIKPVTYATSYNMYTSATATGTFRWLASFSGTSAVVNADATTKNYYSVRALCVRDGVTYLGPASNAVLVTLTDVFQVILATPTVISNAQIQLNWTCPVAAAGYEIYRSTASATTGFVCRATVTGKTYTDACAKGVVNYYKVRAYRYVSGVKKYSSFCAVTPSFGLAVPTITNITASAANIIITVSKVANAKGYTFYHAATSGGTYTRVGSVLASSASYTDSTTGGGGYYKVCAYYVTSANVTINGPLSAAKAAPVVAVTHYRALVIGQGYHNSSVSDLTGTLNDAAGMTTMLGKLTKMKFSVKHLTDQTGSSILANITSTFSGATANDVSLFYYSGHGSSGGNLIGTDFYTSSSGYVSPTQLRTRLDTIPGTKIVIVDSCYSGAIIGKGEKAVSASKATKSFVSSFTAAFTGGSRSNLATGSYYVITACSSTETSAEGNVTSDGVTTRVGYFTAPLCAGCGWNYMSNLVCSKYADTNTDNKITLSELYNYAYYWSRQWNPNQHAQCYPSGSAYSVFVY